MRLFRRFDSITTIFADGGYTGKLIEWAKEMFGYRVEVVKRNEPHKFQVLPKRWIVERTFSWLNGSPDSAKTTNSATHQPNPLSTSPSLPCSCAGLPGF
jgi:transposase